MQFQKLDFEKVFLKSGRIYFTWQDTDFLPYAWLEKKDLENLPTPFYVYDIHPNCPIGLVSKKSDALTNIIELPKNFDELKLDKDFRKDLRRVEKKNEGTVLVENEPNALEHSSKWFLEQFNEPLHEFERRMLLWKKLAYTLSAYIGGKLVGVHIAFKEKNIVYYFGCWWNRDFKNFSIPTFLLKKDIEKAIADGVKFYDLGVGDEQYKKNWGVVEIPTKYYAVLTKDLAKEFQVEEYIECVDCIP